MFIFIDRREVCNKYLFAYVLDIIEAVRNYLMNIKTSSLEEREQLEDKLGGWSSAKRL